MARCSLSQSVSLESCLLAARRHILISSLLWMHRRLIELSCQPYEMHCVRCNAQAQLSAEAAQSLLLQLHEAWEIDTTEPARLKRRFRFKDFRQTMAFVNQVAEIAHQ